MDADIPKTSPVHHPPISWEERFVAKRHSKDGNNRPVGDLFWQDIQVIALSVLQKAGENGAATKMELGTAIETEELQGDEAEVAAAFYNNFDEIKGNGWAQILFGPAKLSIVDIASFCSKGAEVERGFVKVDNLAYWAVDSGNLKKFSPTGSLSISDIRAAQTKANLSVEDKAMLAELDADFQSIAGRSNSVGKTEVDAYYDNFKDTPDFNLKDNFQRDMIRIEINQINPNAHKLFADQDNPLNSVKMDAVDQEFADDCAFKAALAGLAGRRPDEIVKMIKANASTSNFDVQFPGIRDNTFSVAEPTDEELGLFSGRHNSYGFWPTLITKAYGASIYSTADMWTKATTGYDTEDEWAAGRGSGVAAIQALTGHQVFAEHMHKLSDDNLAQRLLDGQRDKRVMLLGTSPTPGDVRTADGFKPHHAYTITDVSMVDGSLELTIRNPLVIEEHGPEGTMQISMPTLRKNFADVYIETDTAL